jgi:hypothetical protein
LHKGSPLEKSHTIPYIKPHNIFASPMNQEMRVVVSFSLPIYFFTSHLFSDYLMKLFSRIFNSFLEFAC